MIASDEHKLGRKHEIVSSVSLELSHTRPVEITQSHLSSCTPRMDVIYLSFRFNTVLSFLKDGFK